eukprot:TRINITY_DN7908_c0_g1_i2.p1 TRINITY_DN7908_c0_g1~~TRINITY_DN7908_c0_g1_i2.p1  ORF type:complete len:174 (+),score=50.68 TRINITY_DN7908_c0_g1_i2:159-680(+)
MCIRDSINAEYGGQCHLMSAQTRRVPTLEEFPVHVVQCTKEKFMSGQGAFIDNCYYARIVDAAFYDMVDLKHNGYPKVYLTVASFGCQFLGPIVHPSKVVVGMRTDDAALLAKGKTGCKSFFGLFDLETGKCYAHGHKVWVHTELNGNDFKPTPIGEQIRQLALKTVPSSAKL